jgi:cytochrome c oxidase cbb3-type subunit 3/ubiquinol-cytochrome c reductase cytochrome c subunit
MAFSILYQQNCAGCHGAHGKNGAAISLANPVYLAVAGKANLRKVTAEGVSGSLMPAFARSAGGTLTDGQIDRLAGGIVQAWSGPNATGASHLPPYAASVKGDPAEGQKAYAEFCSRCHGADGKGGKVPGSIVDPSYLALVSDQSLRSVVIAGRPDERMPDWRSDMSGPGSRAMTDQEITDVVAWLAAQRTTYPGQPYEQ